MCRRRKGKTAAQSLNIFERNPKKTIILTLLVVLFILDYVAGVFFIPENYDLFRCPHHFCHHALVANKNGQARWGKRIFYPVATNSLGFRDKCVRNIPLQSDKRRILLIGDSFIESLGIDYDHSIVGVLEKNIGGKDVEILNAAAVSYSPKLYYLKTKYLIEETGLQFDELYVFIDICDISDEIFYEKFEPEEYSVISDIAYRINKYLKNTSFIYYSLDRVMKKIKDQDVEAVDGLHPSLAPVGNVLPAAARNINADSVPYWTVDNRILKQCAEKGLALAHMNMSKLAALCRNNHIKLTVVVYPWPHQILCRDLESIHVEFWQEFCEQNHLTFINLFPLFVNNVNPNTIIAHYFIRNDVHWNTQGHLVVANEIAKYIH